jgi:RHS repeat-associated protein
LVRDAQGKLRTSYMTARGETVGVVEQNTIAKVLTTLTTRYSFDPLSRLTDVKDAAGHVTHAEYDGRNQMVVLDSPDSGRTEYRYDLAGNVAVKETANLRKAGKLIKYVYDFDRLRTIDYPDSEDVTYTYGAPLSSSEKTGAARGNNAGRVDRVTDESGSETRTYDEMGNVASTTKSPTPVSKWVPTFTYKMSYAFDQFGRATSMTYPDGEVVSYAYNAGGLLDTVKGAGGLPYVKHIGYDEFEQRVFVQLGNDAETTYTYEPTTRRLSDVASGAAGTPLQRLHYNFDLVGNVKDVTNAVPLPTPVAPNGPVVPGPTQFTFAYDDLYQLTSATGLYQGCACGCGNERRFTLDLTYDGIGNIATKKQNDVIAWPSGRVDQQLATTYDWSYKYEGPRPHAPTHVSSREIVYDDDGNQKAVLDPSAGRSLTWSEEDRLRSDIDGFTTSFLYDADGNRTHKRRTTLETVYVNPYYVIRNGLQQTKHVVAGDSRIMSATSALSKVGQPATAGSPTQAYYHPDHLQSTSYVTDASGRILQHDEYFPTGEVWFEEVRNKDSRNRQPWLFNAKELDETGLYYYGARYYDPRLSQWVSPDPILASYMRGAGNGGAYAPRNLGLYSYTWNNPVVFRDPNGLCPDTGASGPCGGGSAPPDSPSYDPEAMAMSATIGMAVVGGAVAVVAVPIMLAEVGLWGTGALLAAPVALETAADAVQVGVAAVDVATNGPNIQNVAGLGIATADLLTGPGVGAEVNTARIAGTPREPYNRQKHYGRSPTASDRKALGAQKGEVVDHDPPLVQRYYEGDPARGEKPGFLLTPGERKASAGDRTRMKLQPSVDSNRQGAEMQRYSQKKKKENGL